MKTLFATLFIATTFSIAAAATPSLRVGMVLLEHTAAGDKTRMAPLVIGPSGKEATIKSGKFEYKITPDIIDDDTVEVRAILIEHDGKIARHVIDQKIKAKCGHTTEVRVDDLIFQTTASLIK